MATIDKPLPNISETVVKVPKQRKTQHGGKIILEQIIICQQKKLLN